MGAGESERCCSVYKRDGSLFVVPSARAIDGFWVAVDGVQAMDESIAPDILGDAVRAALDASTVDVPTPSRDTDLTAPLLQAAGVRTFGQFMRGAKMVWVRRSSHTRLEITPMVNAGPRGGFEFSKHGALHAEAPMANQIGELVSAALSDSG